MKKKFTEKTKNIKNSEKRVMKFTSTIGDQASLNVLGYMEFEKKWKDRDSGKENQHVGCKLVLEIDGKTISLGLYKEDLLATIREWDELELEDDTVEINVTKIPFAVNDQELVIAS